jgi:hypothetical protein
MNKGPVSLAICWMLLSAAQAAVVFVTPGLNNVAIQEVTYTVGGNDVVQSTEASGVSQTGDGEVIVKSIKINDGGVVTLSHFNTEGASVVNMNPGLELISGIGVFDNGAATLSNGGLAAFADAVEVTTTNSDLRNFIYYDFLSPGPPTPGVSDYDILYTRAMNLDDYILVSERFGNTYFEVTPLKADGTPYTGANVLRFGGPGGAAYAVYDWNTGYAAATNQPPQAQTLTVASVSKFFEGTSETPGPVYGFRIDNDGEADIKVLIVSRNTFADNPHNPILVPEPSGFLMAAGAGGLLLVRRSRRSGR